MTNFMGRDCRQARTTPIFMVIKLNCAMSRTPRMSQGVTVFISSRIERVIRLTRPAEIEFKIRADMPNDVEMIITNEGDNGILFEGTEGRFFVNRGKITGKPVEDLKDNPLPEGALEEVFGGRISENHSANFIESMNSREQPISDVWSHNRMLEICHLSNIAMRLDRAVNWDPDKREIVGDAQANSFLARESRQGYEIEM